MKELGDALKGEFTIVNLGCINDADYRLPRNLIQALTVVEVDAEGGSETRAPYHRKIAIQNAISDSKGTASFRRNTFPGTCSLLEPRPGRVEAFGMERYCQTIERMEVQCETLPDLLRRHDIKTLDFLKTDIEGMDFPIIRSCREFMGKTLCIQCELRFSPFYENEPYFHEATSFLAEYGYEVLDLIHIDRWKYKTPHWQYQLEGRALWADFLFVLRPDRMAASFGDKLPEAVAKQIIIVAMMGKKNYGEFLLQQFDSTLPGEWKTELGRLLKPRFFPGLGQSLQALRRTVRPLELFLKHRINRSRHVAIR